MGPAFCRGEVLLAEWWPPGDNATSQGLGEYLSGDPNMRHMGRLFVHGVAALLVSAAAVDAQPVARRVEPAFPWIDSLAAAEFAKDSIGSITMGVVVGLG